MAKKYPDSRFPLEKSSSKKLVPIEPTLDSVRLVIPHIALNEVIIMQIIEAVVIDVITGL